MLFCSSGEAIILGFQHYILALGTAVMIPTVLVPMMGGSDVSVPLHFLDSQS
jgi:xanthine/uracil permease